MKIMRTLGRVGFLKSLFLKFPVLVFLLPFLSLAYAFYFADQQSLAVLMSVCVVCCLTAAAVFLDSASHYTHKTGLLLGALITISITFGFGAVYGLAMLGENYAKHFQVGENSNLYYAMQRRNAKNLVDGYITTMWRQFELSSGAYHDDEVSKRYWKARQELGEIMATKPNESADLALVNKGLVQAAKSIRIETEPELLAAEVNNLLSHFLRREGELDAGRLWAFKDSQSGRAYLGLTQRSRMRLLSQLSDRYIHISRDGSLGTELRALRDYNGTEKNWKRAEEVLATTTFYYFPEVISDVLFAAMACYMGNDLFDEVDLKLKYSDCHDVATGKKTDEELGLHTLDAAAPGVELDAIGFQVMALSGLILSEQINRHLDFAGLDLLDRREVVFSAVLFSAMNVMTSGYADMIPRSRELQTYVALQFLAYVVMILLVLPIGMERPRA